MKIMIGADVVPTPSNQHLFREGNAEELIGEELQAVLANADVKIFNLEVPLTNHVAPIVKCGPSLIAPQDTAKGYKAIGATLLTLANNHIMDQGEQGLWDSCDALKNLGIQYVGAGKTSEEASKPCILEQNEKKYGIYACCEHEFSVVTKECAGANPFDPLESLDQIAALKAQCDYVIVLYHGGKEKYRYPSPQLQKVCRKIVEKGADLVVCQHSHCVGCEEKYLQGTIVYGQGNFIFDDEDDEYYRSGLLIEVNDATGITYIPVVKKANVVRLAQGKEANEIMNGFTERSKEILDETAIEKRYSQFAQAVIKDYLIRFGGKETFAYRLANKILGNALRKRKIHKHYGQQELMVLLNCLECEAHRELIIAGLSK